jgi:hypothetical protein
MGTIDCKAGIGANGSISAAAASYFEGRTDVQCLHRWQKVLNPELVKGQWSKEVRAFLQCMYSYVYANGSEATAAGLVASSASSCLQEDEKIVQLVAKYGAKKWSLIAAELPGRIGKQCRER